MMPWPGGVQQDFLEVPSMMLEQFVYHEPVLKRLSKHVATGDPLDSSTIGSLAGAKHFLAGLGYRRFLGFAAFDMIIHSGPGPYEFQDQTGLSLRELWKVVTQHYSSMTPHQNTFYPGSWYHLVIGYDAGYFGYLWAEVFAYDILTRFTEAIAGDDAASEETDTQFFNAMRRVGLDYRKQI